MTRYHVEVSERSGTGGGRNRDVIKRHRLVGRDRNFDRSPPELTGNRSNDQNRRQQLLDETEHKGSNTDASIDPRRFGFDNIPSDLKTTKASTP
ncbi:hypothetical protein Bca4012_089937 [Brassica carinata]|uniref:Uncharacterized protein n=1 Tax=Brassica carinata TaxID=52824 RepID=A0A8X7PAB0_BRACI|nr:hypothetical protein Bca52824_086726 [Brassica carinata]